MEKINKMNSWRDSNKSNTNLYSKRNPQLTLHRDKENLNDIIHRKCLFMIQNWLILAIFSIFYDGQINILTFLLWVYLLIIFSILTNGGYLFQDHRWCISFSRPQSSYSNLYRKVLPKAFAKVFPSTRFSSSWKMWLPKKIKNLMTSLSLTLLCLFSRKLRPNSPSITCSWNSEVALETRSSSSEMWNYRRWGH